MRQRISPSACEVIAAWCGQVAWSVRVLWFALLAKHMYPLRCYISSCMQACVHQSFFVRAHCSVARTSVLVCAIALVGFARSTCGSIGLLLELMHAGVCVCVRGLVHELFASVRQEAALH